MLQPRLGELVLVCNLCVGDPEEAEEEPEEDARAVFTCGAVDQGADGV